MTMPHLMNCEHSDEGWCLDCVVNQHAEIERLREQLAAAEAERERMRKDAERWCYVRDEEGGQAVFTAAYFNTRTAAELDATIDAAITEEKQ